MMPEQSSGTLIQITDREFRDLISFVYKMYGIDLTKKRGLIEGRLSNTLKAKNMTTFSEYMNFLFSDRSGEEMHTFLNKITTNYSYFARETDHFDFLMQTALPFLENRRSKDLRIWSAGCSSGQEPYNIAMAIDQYFGSRKAGWDTTILATDISTNVLSKAKEAIYPASNLEGLPPQWKKKYFSLLPNGDFQVLPSIKKEVVFRTFNLMDPFVYKKPFDIIFCRNVMIYFDAATTQKLIDKFYRATAPGGYLFIGHSESIDKRTSDYVCLKTAVYQKAEPRR
ncbi:CheR family methyltransferase [Acidaminobacterium chupaoyuni]